MRLQGWEARLAAAIEAARTRPYELGVHDCFRFASSTVLALTGEDPWLRFAGSYRSAREALRVHRGGGIGMDAFYSGVFRAVPVAMPLARRGDIAKVPKRGAWQGALGVVLGAEVALVGKRGLEFLPRAGCVHAWRVG